MSNKNIYECKTLGFIVCLSLLNKSAAMIGFDEKLLFSMVGRS